MLREFIQTSAAYSQSTSNAKNLFLAMTLCHTAIVEKKKDGKIRGFISESYDEFAFLTAAK